MQQASAAELFSKLPANVRACIPDKELASLEHCWRFWARPDQVAPEWDWRTWLILAGRGWGKTRTGAEYVREAVENGVRRVALVGATAADVRDVMIEGESGLLAIFPDAQRPHFEPSKRRLTFYTGATATLYSAEEPERLRGPQHELAWCDELAAWRHLAETWSNLMMGLRLGATRVVVTTTPRPLQMLRDMLLQAGKTVHVTRGRTSDNRGNLPPAFMEQILAAYQGSRLGRQELEGELLEDVPGAIFKHEWIKHLQRAPEGMRVVVAIDPAISVTRKSDETGIVVVGRVGDKAYVLADRSGKFTPDEWARRAIAAYHDFEAELVVAETNRGGDLVEDVLRKTDSSIRFLDVRALKGKGTRAEPCAALYEQGRVFHIGSLTELEDQMVTWDPAEQESPDRVDALVWGLKELFDRDVPKMAPVTNTSGPFMRMRA